MSNPLLLQSAMRWLLIVYLVSVAPVSLMNAQSASPNVSLPRAIHAPKPVYRPEWAKQGLKGKGVVLVTIDPKTGKVIGVQMQESTGNQLLDGAALQAYSQWRFEPGSVPQVKMPIEFSNRPPGQAPGRTAQQQPASSWFLILVGIVAVLFAVPKFLQRRRVGRENLY